jgi:high-affinity iron transporter
MSRWRYFSVRCGLFYFLVVYGSALASPASSWSQVAEEIVARITVAESLYQDGKPTEAGRAVVEAYFGVFEDSKMEAAMRIELGARHTYQVEQQFGALRKAIRQQADVETIRTLTQGIRTAVMHDARALDEARIPMEVFEVDP